MNMFHRPSAFAFFFSSSRTGITFQRGALGVLLLVDRDGGTDMLGHERLYTLEPFLLRSDMVKSIGRSSPDFSALSELFGRTVSPPSLSARPFVFNARCCDDGTGPGYAACANAGALTFPASQTIVSYKCLNCNSRLLGHSGALATRANPEVREIVARDSQVCEQHTTVRAYARPGMTEMKHGERSDQDRDPRRGRAALRRSWLRRRHAARHRGRGRRQSGGGELSFRLQGRADRRTVRHPQPRHQPRAVQRIERGGRCRRRRADIDDILRALVGPTLRGCLGPDPRALDRGALHDPCLDRVGAADPPHQATARSIICANSPPR